MTLPLAGRSTRVLDVGAGDGWFASRLGDTLGPGVDIVCWDTGYPAENRRSGRLLFTANRPEGRFDLILLLDVIEHVEDDRGFLRRLTAETLADDGLVLLSVPAWPLLFSDHDAALGHHRRYAPDRCRALIETAGLSLVRSGGLFHALLAVRTVQKLVETLRPRRTSGDRKRTLEWRGGRLSHRLVCQLLENDIKLSRYAAEKETPLPGLSWWALCRKTR